VAAIVLGPLLLFGPMLVQGRVLFWGTPMLQFVPWHRFAVEVLRSGHLPLWNPLVGAGAPLLANYQSALLYLPNLLLALTGPAYGHGLLVALHLVWAGLGMRALARALGVKPAGAMTAGLAFSLSGYMVARSGFISINHTAAWTPWVVLALDRLLGRLESAGRPRAWAGSLAGLSAALAMQWLAGHAQTAWYTLVLLVLWTAWRLLERGWRARFKAVAVIAAAGGLAFAMSAAQLLPTLEYLGQTARASALGMEYALTYSFWPWRLLGLLLPDLYGSPVRGDFWGYGNYWEDALYLGVLPLLLALGVGVRKLRSKDDTGSLVRLLLLVAAGALLLALGKNTPLYPFLFRSVPTFSLFQAPARWNLLLVFSLALLAGLGVDHWSTPVGRGLYWTRLGTAGTAIIGLAAFLGSLWMGDIEPTFVRAFALAGLWLALSGLLTLFLPKVSGPRLVLVLGIVLLADLVSAGWGLNPSLPGSVYQGSTALAELSAAGEGQRLYMPDELEYAVMFERSHRFETFDPGFEWSLVRETGIPNTPLLESIPSFNNFDPFVPERYTRFVEALDSSPPPIRARLLALAGVGWLAVDRAGGPLDVGYEPLPGSQRLWLMPAGRSAASPAQALEWITAGRFDPELEAIVEAPDSRGDLVGGPAQARMLASQGPNTLRMAVEAPEGTWLVVAESWYPGWRLTIDGEPAEMYPAFVAFRGCWIPAGEHELQMTYRPATFYAGAALAVLGWLLCAGLRLRWKND